MEVHLVTGMMSGVERPESLDPVAAVDGLEERLIEQLVGQVRAGGLELTGEGGVLQVLTKRLLASALEGEITDHLGCDKHDPTGRGTGCSCNGARSKTVLTDVGSVEIEVPRDRNAEFVPRIVGKWGEAVDRGR